ncbi:hypothetical protein [Methylococcus mesophilus]|uniref:hypothetical protein n=1 Tax=Methylococcus mesophilus TaxID=2993564 RepID=UPI00224B6F92|nr:hypothetical protein [Methylococcus mesophilus]UZR27465.1 hypothetical protein OOT43_12045 [Methylococcus mesophilus]
MNTAEFTELAGRIEGLGAAFLCLVAELENRRAMDGSRFTSGLHRIAGELCFEQPHLEETKRTVRELAAELDAMRERRIHGR